MLEHTNSYTVINVKKNNRYSKSTTSKGTQLKWITDNKFIKQNIANWYEDISEVLVSYLLTFTNIKHYVTYYPSKVFEEGTYVGTGCYSYNFLKYGENDITFARLAKQYGIKNLGIMNYTDVRDFLLDATNIDLKPYIDCCLCLDSITYNEDRHFNNLSVVLCDNGTYRPAPIYDNGLACLADTFTYPMDVDLHTNLKSVHANPFKLDFKEQVLQASVTPILIDYDGFVNTVYPKTAEEKRAFEVIKIGLNRMKGIAWEEF